MSYNFNSYSPYNLGQYKTRRLHREDGDERAPGGPVRRGYRHYNYGMSNVDPRLSLRHLKYSPEELRTPSPKQLPPPMSPLEGQFSLQEVPPLPLFHNLGSPSPHLQEERLWLVPQRRLPTLTQSTHRQDLYPPFERFRPARLLQSPPQRELCWPSKRARQPSPEYKEFPRVGVFGVPTPEQPTPVPSPPPPPPPRRKPKKARLALSHYTAEKMRKNNSDCLKKMLDSWSREYNDTSYNVAGVKVKKKLTNKEWRLRQNTHLRRLLMPKNALNVLNEMLPGEKGISQFKVVPAPPAAYCDWPHTHSFCAQLTIDGVSYKGYGSSKLAARNEAAEQVIRDLILKHMLKLQRRNEAHLAGEERGGGEEEEDDGATQALPMLQLASFALHKLFSEWECEGHKVPKLRGPPPPPMSEGGPPRLLPEGAAAMHPCLLLLYMRPDLQYRDVPSDSKLYFMSVDVDGKTYVGRGTTKRNARRAAARAACTQHFKVQFKERSPSCPSSPVAHRGPAARASCAAITD